MDSYDVTPSELGGFIVDVGYELDGGIASYTFGTEAEAMDWIVRQKQIESGDQLKS